LSGMSPGGLFSAAFGLGAELFDDELPQAATITVQSSATIDVKKLRVRMPATLGAPGERSVAARSTPGQTSSRAG